MTPANERIEDIRRSMATIARRLDDAESELRAGRRNTAAGILWDLAWEDVGAMRCDIENAAEAIEGGADE